MAQGSFTLARNSDWVQVAPAGPVVIQRREGGNVLLFVSAAKPTTDEGAFILTPEAPAFSHTVQNPVWIRPASYATTDTKVSVLS